MDKTDKKQSFQNKYFIFFLITAIIPILLFLMVLKQHHLLNERSILLIFGLGVVIALLGFLFFLRLIKQINTLVSDFGKIERGEIETLDEPADISELHEITRISNSFNKILLDLKDHTKELESLVSKLTTLSEITELVSKIPDINEVLRVVLNRTMIAVQAGIGSIMLLDDEKQTLAIVAAAGLDENIVKKTKINLGEGISGRVAQTGDPVLVEDLEQDQRFKRPSNPKYGTSSFICLPLKAKTRILGVLNLSKKSGHRIFGESDLSFLTALLGHVSYALENAKLLKDSKIAAHKLQYLLERQKSQLKQVSQEAVRSTKLFQQAQKMEAVGTLAGGIAHDFNNLLMGIQGNISIISKHIDSNAALFERIKKIERIIASGADLTKQLLGFASRGKYHSKPTNLNDLIKKSIELFGRTRKEINILTHYQNNIWIVDVDRGQIEQTLLNLYVNAWQAMPNGGDLKITTANIRIKKNSIEIASGLTPGKYVKIAITDTGIGMDENTRQRVFEPFFTTKDIVRGTGLGLASAYGIIKNHNGLINVISKKDAGSTFSILLPANEAEVVEEVSTPSVTLKGSETILLVEDEEMIIDICKDILMDLGYRVLCARSGKKALQIYMQNKTKIDIIVLDMVMPKMSGKETYDRLKQINPDIKVLLASGYSLDERAEEIMALGCNGFIQKPFDPAALSKEIRKILDY